MKARQEAGIFGFTFIFEYESGGVAEYRFNSFFQRIKILVNGNEIFVCEQSNPERLGAFYEAIEDATEMHIEKGNLFEALTKFFGLFIKPGQIPAFFEALNNRKPFYFSCMDIESKRENFKSLSTTEKNLIESYLGVVVGQNNVPILDRTGGFSLFSPVNTINFLGFHTDGNNQEWIFFINFDSGNLKKLPISKEESEALHKAFAEILR